MKERAKETALRHRVAAKVPEEIKNDETKRDGTKRDASPTPNMLGDSKWPTDWSLKQEREWQAEIEAKRERILQEPLPQKAQKEMPRARVNAAGSRKGQRRSTTK